MNGRQGIDRDLTRVSGEAHGFCSHAPPWRAARTALASPAEERRQALAATLA